MQIERLPDGSIFMHQENYAKKIVHRFRIEDVNAVASPADPHHQMCANVHKNGHQEVSNCPYRQVIGSLMYLSIGARPDITFFMNSQYFKEPKKIHWNACKRILKYLKATMDHELFFPARQINCLQTFSDADYAGDVETRRSTTDLVVKLGEATIAWSSSKQKVVTLSTTHHRS